MPLAEAIWRVRAGLYQGLDKSRTWFSTPTWNRSALLPRLARLPELESVRAALRSHDWDRAHALLSIHFTAAPARFLISPVALGAVAARVTSHFPYSAHEAAAPADRILGGEYDLLGYRGLRFDRVEGRTASDSARHRAAIDWHSDPVHHQRVAPAFWTDVPFLDASSGDHKIIWELNRHQHWLTLGRAYWLTGDPRYRAAALNEFQDWLQANPPLLGINWASMLELGFRALSWLWALNFFVAADAADAAPWTVDLLLALDFQLTQIERNLSYYFSPNTHLLGEAFALYAAGTALPLLARSKRRTALGRRVLLSEISRQIAADGGHCERSTHYHRYALDFYLQALAIARLTGDPAADAFADAAVRLAAAARLLCDDRGLLPHFGDDDGGGVTPIMRRSPDDIRDSLAVAGVLANRADWQIGTIPEEAYWILAQPAFAAAVDRAAARERSPDGASAVVSPIAPTSGALPDTGYYVSRSARGAQVVIDGGPHGYQNAGHAHADALSLTMTVRGLPLLIDPGTGCYTVNPRLRDRLRSTACHNTLELDGRSQSTPNGPFHWSSVANSRVRRWRVNPSFDYFDGVHDGYRPLEHVRHAFSLHEDLLIVADLVRARGITDDDSARVHGTEPRMCHAAVHWHIDPRWRVEREGRRASCLADDECIEIATCGAADTVVELFHGDEGSALGWHAPVYGRVEPASTLRIVREGVPPLWIVSVFDLTGGGTALDVNLLPVWAEAGVLEHAVAIRIGRPGATDFFLVAEPGPTPPGHASRTWRIGEFETDARMLFCRVLPDHQVGRMALVDGSVVKTSSQRLLLARPAPVTDLHLDGSAIRAEMKRR